MIEEACFGREMLTPIREDAWHLAQMLPTITSETPPATPPTVDSMNSSELKAVFEAFAKKRQPRTASIMSISRGVGEMKCPTTAEGEKKRNDYYREVGNNLDAAGKLYDDWFSQPF
jgi:salicylate hydroxylase